jgi:hypothetical protein
VWFVALTFRNSLSNRTCNRIFLDWIAELEKLDGKQIQWGRMIERGGTTGRLHIHVLIEGTPHISMQTAKALWEQLAGTAIIGEYDPERRGVEYMLKDMEDNRGRRDWVGIVGAGESTSGTRTPNPASL